ncbi:AcaB family transcriptional regulator [Vibrio sp. 1180_3]|uniref:AcaB family transcriptional regulator n=1 Tax=Vibrio sp. 1180_3 TaxID=2528832 RepID=UPI002406261B|nr:AcaB family transcriptional regulator [Vibrio sp. 1180_3]MDF9399108.1 DUF1845 domain-containing protein [Vibrio sp. 1180_3]
MNSKNKSVKEISNTPFEHGAPMDVAGTMVENKPSQTYVTIRFYTKVAPKMLFSIKNADTKDKNKFVIGVDWFDTKLAPLFNAIRNDDPFADQMLLDIENGIETLGDMYKSKQENIRNLISSNLKMASSSIEFPDNGHTSECKVSFNNRLAYSFLWLTKELDNYMYYLHLADKFNVINRETYNDEWSDAKRAFRRTLGLINAWKPTSITRVDLAQNTARVAIAFGINERVNLSQEVLFLQNRASTAPAINDWKNGIINDEILSMLKNNFT